LTFILWGLKSKIQAITGTIKYLINMKIYLLAFCLLCMSAFGVHSRELTEKPPARAFFLHLESGFIYPGGNIRDNLAIRQNIGSGYAHHSSTGNIYADSYGFAGGMKLEYFNPVLMFGITTGLRFTRFNTAITGYSSSISDFFYLRYSMGGSDTKFARVKSITETNNFIGIPVELRFIPLSLTRSGYLSRQGRNSAS
jgi:hypothetical protein